MLLSITWNARPEIIEGFHVRWYGLLFAGGFVFGYMILKKIFAKEGLDEKLLDNFTLYAFLGTLIGARLGHCLFYQPEIYLSDPIEILKVWEGGLASHGGVIGLFIAFYLFSKKYAINYLWIVSRVVIVAALAAAMIRLGNLMNSEIYGHETDLPWGFIFVRDKQTVAKHPTQLYEAFAYLLLFAGLMWYYFKNIKLKKVKTNIILGIFFISLFTARFFIEFVKEVQVVKETSMALNLGQWLSIPFILLGIAFLFVKGNSSPKIEGKKQ